MERASTLAKASHRRRASSRRGSGEIFNELYYLADGGTLWGTRTRRHWAIRAPPRSTDSFTYLECFDYSATTARGRSLLRLVCTAEISGRRSRSRKCASTRHHPRVESAALRVGLEGLREHQMVEYRRAKSREPAPRPGFSREDPLVIPNQYNYQDVCNWRDLNSKYVLMVWRDYALTGRRTTLSCAIAGAP